MSTEFKPTAAQWDDFKTFARLKGCRVLVKSDRAFRSTKAGAGGAYKHVKLVGFKDGQPVVEWYKKQLKG